MILYVSVQNESRYSDDCSDKWLWRFLCELSYVWIEPLEERPKKKSRYRKKSLGRSIVDEFQKANIEYARISYDKIKSYYVSTRTAARSIGRILSANKLSDQILVYSDEEFVYLEKNPKYLQPPKKDL